MFTGAIGPVEACGADTPARRIGERLAAGEAVVLSGPYTFVDAVYRYCQRFERSLVTSEEFEHITDRVRRNAALADERHRRLHRLFVLARGESLLGVQDAPETPGLQDWLQKPVGDTVFLMPVRRFQRVITDIRRAREGIAMDALGGTITILPHVYVPSDRSVPRMIERFAPLMRDKAVLDMGTGTGVLALIAARLGAARVVATDVNPKAVENARLNAERLGLSGRVEVRGPGDLFETVRGERFDVILFNAPWILGEPVTLYDAAIYDPGYRVIDGFLRDAPGHLAEGGTILLQYSNISQRRGDSSLDRLHDTVAGHGLRIVSSGHISRMSRVLGRKERVLLFEIRGR